MSLPTFVFSEDFSDLTFDETESLPSSKGKGGAKLDALLYGIICRIASYVEHIGNKMALVGLVNGEDYTALTGQDGRYGFYVWSGKEAIGPIGAPSLGKIMAHFGMGLEDVIVSKKNGLSAIWNSPNPKCQARIELGKQIPRYVKAFEEKGNPFLAYEESNQPSLFDTDDKPETSEA